MPDEGQSVTTRSVRPSPSRSRRDHSASPEELSLIRSNSFVSNPVGNDQEVAVEEKPAPVLL